MGKKGKKKSVSLSAKWVLKKKEPGLLEIQTDLVVLWEGWCLVTGTEQTCTEGSNLEAENLVLDQHHSRTRGEISLN